ncbi:hypothetical protein PSRA_1252 [Pseudoscardovia radai]|uniref:Helix-turn-helix domain-containing protein n=1 Tax=Pseudoscardovia radai TaxID=987066 RepID=A0A261EWG6_9BIFI|nr:AlpA family phage regulatory protein [Pseudoscardovia radai]OZG51210.1 hypothetical protein PSRA_1252 [Pseudoscardovia radai]
MTLLEPTINFGNDDGDRLISVKEFCAITGFSENRAAQMRKHGDGPIYRRLAPRHIVYRLGDVRDWIDACAHTSTSEYEKGKDEK